MRTFKFAPRRGGAGSGKSAATALDPSGMLTIDCRGCSTYPDAGSPVCVRCIVSRLSELGPADRIRLSAGKDSEISGPAVELLCELASISGPAVAPGRGSGCARCDRSPERVTEDAWADFPDPSFRSASERLYTRSDDGPECSACLQRTHAELVLAEREMEGIRRRARELAEGGRGRR